MDLQSYLNEINNTIECDVESALKEKLESLSNTFSDFMKDANHVKSQIGKSKYMALSESNKGKENEDAKNDSKPAPRSVRQSRRAALAVKSENLFNASKTVEETASENEISTVKIKKEKEDMPAPKKPVPRKKKIKTEPVEQPSTRSTRSKVKKVLETEKIKQERKDSDVIIENPSVPVVDLVDDESQSKDLEVEQNTTAKKKASRQTKTKASAAVETSTRSTRTKTKNSKRELEAAEETQERKKSRSTSSAKADATSEYEDAISTVETVQNATYVAGTTAEANATYVAKKSDPKVADKTYTPKGLPQSKNNETIVVNKPTVIQHTASHDDNLMTDDDSDIEIKKAPKVAAKSQKTESVKQVFNPFEPSPVKKKVEAFEKLGNPKSSVLKTGKPGMATPTTNKFVPKHSSTSKISKAIPNRGVSGTPGNQSFLSAKTQSELKASRAEYKRREAEALKKKEEVRKRREEAVLKAQEQKEKERQLLLAQQRLKEERAKAHMAELEEKKQKLKEEHERRRLAAKEKAKKLKEEELRKEAEKKQKKNEPAQSSLPIYMTTPGPLLPTVDCYDSDDERAPKKIPVLAWCERQELKEMEIAMLVAGDSLKNTFFCMQATTPDLQEIFGTLDPRKLKRTSSACWKKPPRYTLMPTINDLEEDNE